MAQRINTVEFPFTYQMQPFVSDDLYSTHDVAMLFTGTFTSRLISALKRFSFNLKRALF